jgi:hypothetical protein
MKIVLRVFCLFRGCFRVLLFSCFSVSCLIFNKLLPFILQAKSRWRILAVWKDCVRTSESRRFQRKFCFTVQMTELYQSERYVSVVWEWPYSIVLSKVNHYNIGPIDCRLSSQCYSLDFWNLCEEPWTLQVLITLPVQVLVTLQVQVLATASGSGSDSCFRFRFW